MMKTVMRAKLIFSVFLLITALSFPTANGRAAGPQKPTEVWPYLAELKGDERTKVVTEQAGKEGHVVVYGTLGIDRAQIFIKPFEQRYPNVAVDFVRQTTGEISQRILAEQQAGKQTADIVICSPALLTLIKNAIAPYEPTSWEDFDPSFRYGSSKDGWTSIDYEVLPYVIAWRTDRISDAEAPKSFDALMNPKWAGRTGTVLDLEGTIDGFIKLFGEEEGMKKVDRLAALQNRTYPSIGALNSAIASGEIDIAWHLGGYRAGALKAKGVPVDFVFEDPTFAVTDSISVAKEAPHPYAAALFMEYMTSPQTLEAMDKTEPGRLFGNLKGSYSNSLKDFPNLYVLTPLDKARYKELNRIVEDKFVRR
jgi:iron(III) transport system substrate-binding protein